MATYRTPNVYIEEISSFPPSIAEVETAIPAFIGYTERATHNTDGDLLKKATRISSWPDYQLYFGAPFLNQINLTVTGNAASGFTVQSFSVSSATRLGKNITAAPPANPPQRDLTPDFLMAYSVQAFFANGGGACYVIPVNTYFPPPGVGASLLNPIIPNQEDLLAGLDVLALEDEPTLIVVPDAVNLPYKGYLKLAQQALLQCSKLQNRFCVFDLYHGTIPPNAALDGDATTSGDFPPDGSDTHCQSVDRAYYGVNNLKYGAAYYPFLQMATGYYAGIPGDANYGSNVTVTYNATAVNLKSISKPPAGPAGGGGAADGGAAGGGAAGGGAAGGGAAGGGAAGGGAAGGGAAGGGAAGGGAAGGGAAGGGAAGGGAANPRPPGPPLYNFVKTALQNYSIVLPPSGAVVGVYANIDNARGVWKAPANVSLIGVTAPMVKIDNEAQDNLNIDVDAGKSINVIRSFTGKGTLIWGARTLDGNSNEWRYVSIRRFFTMVEESVKKSTYWAVFEPNDAGTWMKIRAMIENYLRQKHRDGALAGATEKEAFFVKCGIGTTMNSQDILEGRLIVEVGMAVVRPAEFIILQFSHMLQTS